MRVLVTGAEQRQGLAVIRALGLAGNYVIAAGARRLSLGFASRYTADCHRYRSPGVDPEGFVADLLRIIAATRPNVVIPAVESTMVALDQARDRIEAQTTLAAPPSPALSFAIDKAKTLRLAARVGVPTPRTVQGETAMDLLCRAAELRFPVAVKPRGNGGYRATAHRLPFKVQYARDFTQLRDIVTPHQRDAACFLVQEYVPGTGRCVAAVCDHGNPIAMFAYDRRREWPHSGGVSVMRRSIALDHLLYAHTVALLGAIGWHGVAMVEFKYDSATESYTLMEINPRFQASTALSVDAGLNFPHLVASLFAGTYEGQPHVYELGVEARWLRGDLLALLDALQPHGRAYRNGSPSRWRAVREFVADFRRGVHYDEFQLADWRPGVVEAVGIAGELAGWVAKQTRSLAGAAVGRLWPTNGGRGDLPATSRTRSARTLRRTAASQSAQNLPIR